MISRALLNAPFFIPKDADLLRNRKVNTKKRQNRHLPELAFLILGTYFTAPILAAFAMDISFFGIMTRLIRTNMIQVLKQDYIRASRAKGLSSVNVILRHGLKNILIPVLTRLVSIVIGFFCGSAVIESIFSIQGIGNLALKSVISKDTPVLQCFIFILAVGIVVLNFLVDIAYSAIDRRIQLK